MSVNNIFLIMAREITTDADDNMTSIFKVVSGFSFDLNYDQLAKDNIKPGVDEISLPASYAIATSWDFSEKLAKATVYNFRITVLDPAGKKLSGGPEKENVLPAGSDKFNMNFHINGMAVTKEGNYILRAEVLSKDGKSLAKAEYPFDVSFNKSSG